MKITMPRGDIRNVQFTIKDMNGDVAAVDFSEIFFTCKKRRSDRNVCIQKSLSGNTIEKINDGVYQFTIEPSDTDYLDFGTYIFDIEIIYSDTIKQTTVGTLTLTDEVTHAGDERHG